MPKITYKARHGAAFDDKKAAVYGKRIKTLMEKLGGRINPADIVADAENPRSPWHEHFDWSDSSAAKKYRLQQAREILSNIVEVVVVEKKKESQRSFFSVADKINNERIYVPLREAVSNPDYRNQLYMRFDSQLGNLRVTMKMLREAEQKHR